MTIIGIDPGLGGGIAVIDKFETGLQATKKLTETDAAEFLRHYAGGDCFAYIERVGAYRVEGRQQGGKSMFTFGQSYGFLRGILVALRIPFEEVGAAKWQGEFSLKRTDKGESSTDKKNRHKAKAQQLFPDLKITHATADALLIAEYGKRKRASEVVCV